MAMTREDAIKINFRAGSKLEECVDILIKAREKGESVYGEFNGHKLYSCDVTMDSAFEEVLGMTKEEFDEEEANWRKEFKERMKKEEETAIARIPEWIERGKAFIYPENLEEWEECVKARAEDISHGIDVEYALDLMEKLDDNVPMNEVIEIFNRQGNSGATAGMIRKILFIFSKRGPEFFESTTDRELSEEERETIESKKRENAALEELHRKKETYEERIKREEEEAIVKIPELKERGKAVIFTERWESWEECVEARCEDLYHGWDLERALEIMEKLESGVPMEETIAMFKEQGHSGASGSMVRRIIFDFSKRGPEFYELVIERELDEEERKIVDEKKKENENLVALHTHKETVTSREQEESEIASLATRRMQLITEISQIEIELANLKVKEQELKKRLEGKQEELNKLFE